MNDPGFALLVGLAVLAVLVLFFWPNLGVVARWRRALRLNERVRTEDALKHLQDLEYRRQTPSLQSLAGALSIPPARAVELLSRMEALGLTRMDADGPRLTPEGRAYALRIIRIHRLWERHLAEETGWREEQWHRQAEVREHTTSAEEADELAERMGHPRFDPHGDPIPTAAGELPQFRGQSLPTVGEGTLAAIVHLEDEPEAVFAQLVAEALHPGMKVQVVEATSSRIRFWADGDEARSRREHHGRAVARGRGRRAARGDPHLAPSGRGRMGAPSRAGLPRPAAAAPHGSRHPARDARRRGNPGPGRLTDRLPGARCARRVAQ